MLLGMHESLDRLAATTVEGILEAIYVAPGERRDQFRKKIADAMKGEKRLLRAKLGGKMGPVISSVSTMLEELKRAMIGQLVSEQRSAIEELWCKTNTSVAERASFDAYFQIRDDEKLTSEVLAKHEDYLASLKAKLETKQRLIVGSSSADSKKRKSPPEQQLIVGSSSCRKSPLELVTAAAAAAKRDLVDLTSDDIDIDDDDDDKRPDDDDDDGDGGDDRKRPARVTASPTSLVARSIGPVDEALVASGPVNFSLMRAKLLAGERRTIDFRVSQPCPSACRDPKCPLGHSCKCSKDHKAPGDVFPAFCFPVKNGRRLLSCLEKMMRNTKMIELRKVDLLTFLTVRANTVRNSTSHNWSAKPSPLVTFVFVLQLVKWYIAYPNTPFKVTSTTFADIREHDDNELRAMKESLLNKLDFSAVRCWYTGMLLTIGTHGGHTMFSIDQGDPSLKSDAEGQTWYICTLWSNRYKLNMNPKVFIAHMDHLSSKYNPLAGDTSYTAYVRGDVVRVTSTIPTTVIQVKLDNMRLKATRTEGQIECGYTSSYDVMRHCMKMGNRCLITGIPYKKRVFPLSLDRKTDDLHHNSDDCHLIGAYLNFAKGEHVAFKSREALAAYCREHDIDESGSEHDKICKIIRPIIDLMIKRWREIRD